MLTTAGLKSSLTLIVVLIGAMIAVRMMLKLTGAEWRVRRLRSLHRCEDGSVQSLSFVITLPLLLTALLLIVQSSQILTGNILVQYAALASARSAIVWIPANVGGEETENRISSHTIASQRHGGVHGTTYRIHPSGWKYRKIRQAAVVACLPLAPSRDLGYAAGQEGLDLAAALQRTHLSDPSQAPISLRRWVAKLAYSLANTDVDVQFTHRPGPPGLNREPPLGRQYNVPPYPDEYQRNEVGWRDRVSVTVTHRLALLPGPARWFARRDEARPLTDPRGAVYVWPLTATATLENEGEKPLSSFLQETH